MRWRRQAPPFPEFVIHRELVFQAQIPRPSRQRVLANQLRRGVLDSPVESAEFEPVLLRLPPLHHHRNGPGVVDLGAAILVSALSDQGELSAGLCAAVSGGQYAYGRCGFNGEATRPEVQRWRLLSGEYWRRFEAHLPVLLRQVGNAFGPVRQRIRSWK